MQVLHKAALVRRSLVVVVEVGAVRIPVGEGNLAAVELDHIAEVEVVHNLAVAAVHNLAAEEVGHIQAAGVARSPVEEVVGHIQAAAVVRSLVEEVVDHIAVAGVGHKPADHLEVEVGHILAEAAAVHTLAEGAVHMLVVQEVELHTGRPLVDSRAEVSLFQLLVQVFIDPGYCLRPCGGAPY